METNDEDRLKRVTKQLDKTRAAEAAAWQELVETVRDVYNRGGGNVSYLEIGRILGVTRARVHQIVNNDTKPRHPPHPIANKDLVDAQST